MARGRVYSEVIRLKSRGGIKVIRRWGFRVSGWNGVVLRDDGYASQQDALADANRLVAAVGLIEQRGHKLKPWEKLVDEARI